MRRDSAAEHDPARVAVFSVHTSPEDQPGMGDSGGLNVYVLAVARRLAEQGIAVDVYTRRRDRDDPGVRELTPGSRVISVEAGPPSPVPKEDLPALLPDFLGGVLTHAAVDDAADARKHAPYDVVHSHYWLSGWVGGRAKEIWGVPHVASFHTLGGVKNATAGDRESAEPPRRLHGELAVVRGADRILAPTPREAVDLVGLYGADPHRIRVVPPGVDRTLFVPRPAGQTPARLGLPDGRIVLFVGRFQPFKGPDLAVLTFARAAAQSPATMADAVLVMVGGPSGEAHGEETEQLQRLAAAAGVADRVAFFPPQPHERLGDFYSAAEVVLVPSRSESFGLVALEAQACGTPVVATAAGGLRWSVRDGVTGLLVERRRPEDFAGALVSILSDPALRLRMSLAAVQHAGRFSWEATAGSIRQVYRELAAGAAS